MHGIWPDDSQENYLNCCHQMPDFKAKMHQIRFRLGLRPRRPPDAAGGAYSAPPDSLAGFKGATSKGREGEGEGKGGRGGEGTGGEGPSCLSVAPWLRKLDPPLHISCLENNKSIL